MRSIWTSIVASLLLIVAVGGTVGLIVYTRMRMDSAPMQPPVESAEIVGFATAETVETRASATAIGTVLATKFLQLKTELVGTVTEVNFSSGQVVEKGALLVKLDTSVEDAQLDSAKAALDIADSTFRRSELAWKSKAISDLEFDQTKTILQQAKSEVARLQAIINKKTLVAPFNAKAGLFDLQPGQYLPEGTLITTLQGIEPEVYVDFMMPQHVADYMRTGDSIALSSLDEPLHAEIIAIDAQADKITRNIMARAILKSPPASLQPNDSVKVEMSYGPVITAVKIPYAALRNAPTGAYVYTANDDDSQPGNLRATMKPVQPGKSVAGFITILHGIEPGDRVITDGSFKLRPGSLVTNGPPKGSES